MKTIYFCTLLAGPLLLSNCKKAEEMKSEVKTAGDTSFAKNTFESLANGDTSVEEKIDWATFSATGSEVSAVYNKLPGEEMKKDYRASFITSFAKNFRDAGSSVDTYKNWRVLDHDSQRTDVAADGPKGTLKVTVTNRDNTKRISALTLLKAQD